jgi:hypothetical protein
MRGRKRKEKPTEPEGTNGPIFCEVEDAADAAEMLAMFKDAGDKDQAATNLRTEFDRLKAKTKEVRAEADMAIRSALHFARTGKVLRRVKVIEVVDEARGVVRLMREDQPDVEVRVRALTAGEIQALKVARPAEVGAILGEVAQRAEGAFDFGDNEPAPPVAHPADVAALAEAVQH